jgi:hypothetical protein
MPIRLIACAWTLLCATAAAAQSSPLPVPTVEYSAERVIESEAGTFGGKVHSSLGKERTEMDVGGMKSVMILRPDLQLGWMLMPAQKMYQQVDLSKARQQAGAGPAEDVQISVVGEEEVEGHATTKYKLRMTDGSAGGFIWFTHEGIAVKMDLLTKARGRTERMTIRLTNLQVGAQDPVQFELPGDYTKMPAFGAAFGGAPASPAAVHAPKTPVGAVFGGAKKLLGVGR